MRVGTLIVIIAILTLLVGAMPLIWSGKVLETVGHALRTVGGWIDFWGWNGISFSRGVQ
jgi:hypothetical protein